MAGDSKLLGTLELSSGDVLKTIQTVNDALKTLGKGVDLDLTNSLKASVEKMMEPLKKQINEVSQAATKIKAPDLSEIKEATKLLQEYYKTRAELFKSQDSRDSDRLSEKQKEIEANLSKYNDTVRAQAEQSAAAQKAQDAYEKTVSAVNDKIATAREKSAEKASKAELAAEQKAVEEEQKLREQQQKDMEALYAHLEEMEKRSADQEREQMQNRAAYYQEWAEKRQALIKQQEEEEKALQAHLAEMEQRTGSENAAQVAEKTRYYQEWAKIRENLAKEAEEKETATTLAGLEERAAALRAYGQQQEAAAAAEKKLQEDIRAYNVQSLNEQMKARQDYVNWWVSALEKQEAEQKKEFNNQVQEAAKLNQEIQRINAQLNNSTTGAATRDALQVQLQAKVTAYNQYSQEVRRAAEADREVLKLQEQITLESAKQADALAEAARKEAERKAQQQNDRIGNQIATKVGQFSLNLIKNQWSAAVDYAQTYYNKLNEIRTVTGKTEEEATKMGDSLRRLAKEMSVTSTELAEAAVTFYRQGLEDEQVEARLEWVTKYAKIAKIEFSSAAELVTAAMNSMAKDINGDVQRVVDVFLYLGDAAATSGEEIGKAMQKASASATEFGLSFEWLGAYIATVAETTRQAPESIGNAFNSMLARMHNIKQKGFNEEDATRINDVAKALATVDVALLDSENNWRDMSEIFKDISEKWADMDGKQKSYIATTLAGTRQQNVFFALMNDMSKGLEEGSRAWKLYEGAMEAAGTAADKYSIWQESAEAAQERLKNSLERLYASMKPGLIKDFYNSISWLVDGISKFDGAAVAIGAIAGAIIVFASAVTKAGGVLKATRAAFMDHPIFMAATIAVGVVAAFGAINQALGQSAEKVEQASKAMEDSKSKIEDYKKSQEQQKDVYSKLEKGIILTKEETSDYNKLLDKLIEISPTAKKVVEDLRDGVISQKDAYAALNEEIEKAIQKQKDEARFAASTKLSNFSIPEDQDVMMTREYYDKVMRFRGYGGENPTGTPNDWFGAVTESSPYGRGPEITKMIESFRDFMQNYRGSEEQWNTGLDIYFNQQKANQENLREQAEDLIQSAFLIVDKELDSVERGYLTNKLMERQLTDSGEIDPKKLNTFGTWLMTNIFTAVDEATDATSKTWNQGILEQLLLNIFGDNTYGRDALRLFSDEISELANDGEIVDKITQAYEQLLEMGLSNANIGTLLTERLNGLTGLIDDAFLEWISGLKNKSLTFDELKNGLFGVLFGKEDVLDASSQFTKEVNGNLIGLDKESLALMSNLALQGKTYEELLNIFNDEKVKSIVDFKAAQRELSGVAASTASDVEESENKTENSAEKTKKTISDIQGQIEDYKKLKEYQEDGIMIPIDLQLKYGGLIGKEGTELAPALENIKREIMSDLGEYFKSNETMFIEQQKRQFGQNWDARQDWLDKNGIKTFQQLFDYGAANGYTRDMYEALEFVNNAVRELYKIAFATEEVEEKTKQFAEFVKEISGSLSAVDKIDAMIEEAESGKMPSVSDLLNLSETHPDVMTVIGDLKALEEKLKEIKKLEEDNTKTKATSMIKNSKELYASPSFKFMKSTGDALGAQYGINIETIQDLENLINSPEYLANSSSESVERTISNLNALVNEYVENILKAAQANEEAVDSTEKLKVGWQQLADEAKRAGVEISDKDSLESFLYDRFKYMSHDDIGTYMKKQLQLGNVDLLNRPKYIDEDGNYETVFSTGYNVGQNDKTYNLVVTPILPDGTKLDNEALDAYIDQLQLSGDILEADKVENGGLGLVLWMQELGENIEDDNQKAELFAETLHVLQDLYYADTSIEGFAKKAADEIEMARAAAENFQVQLMELLSILQGGGDYNDFYSKWMGIDPNIQEAMLKQFPQLAIAINDAKKATEQFGVGSQEADSKLKVLNRTIENITKNNAAQYFDKTVKAIDSVYKGSTRIVDGYAAMNKEIETAIKAQIEYETASKELAAGNEINANSISNIASLLGGLDTQWIIDNWAQIGPSMSAALQEGEEAIQRFNEAAFITITGTSVANFSDLIDGLISVENLSKQAVAALVDTGQWTVETISLPQEGAQWDPIGKQWIKTMMNVNQSVLRYTGNNPLSPKGSSYKPKTSSSTRTSTPRSSGSGGRSGGGGGGSGNSSSSSDEMTEVERMLDAMEQIQKIYSNTRNMFQAEQNYYKQTGELQGVILYLQKEGELLVEQNKVIEDNVKEIETWMAQKKQELSTLSNSSEEYKTAADDLKALEERHQQYSKELIDNKTQLDKLNKSIKEQNDAVRQMEIDLRNTILEAIKDREALNERMLEGTITTENTILDLIQKRYEKERDMILDNAQKQIDALKEERDLLSEQLQLRKEQEEMQDKAAQLADLESKYARITADPTRRNEALSLQKQIEELRRDMSWDTAERELKAQQENLDNQISSIEDYVEYVRNWYDELFKHPRRLIEEMKSIIVQVDDDIITWLKEADESFAEATEATQTKMVNDWSQMLMDMHGEIKTYWDEVEEIIAGGDEAIIKFLAENSAAYREAGKLQAQAYVDQWKKQLSDLAAAHRKVTDNLVLNTYSVFNAMAKALSGGRSGGSSGGGSSGSISAYGGGSSVTTGGGSVQSSSSVDKARMAPKYYSMSFMNSTGIGSTKGAAYDDLIGKAGAAAEAYGYDYFADRAVAHYAEGGKINYTGPAWVDGTAQRPEAILNPQQTELFETLVSTLSTIAKVRVPNMPVFGDNQSNASFAGGVNVGDIILNIDSIETDDDYEDIAQRVIDVIMERVNRGSAIGGIRF